MVRYVASPLRQSRITAVANAACAFLRGGIVPWDMACIYELTLESIVPVNNISAVCVSPVGHELRQLRCISLNGCVAANFVPLPIKVLGHSLPSNPRRDQQVAA